MLVRCLPASVQSARSVFEKHTRPQSFSFDHVFNGSNG